MRRSNRENEEKRRRDGKENVRLLLETIQLDIRMTWKKWQDVYMSKQAFHEDEILWEMDLLDCLLVFEDRMKIIEDKFFEKHNRDRALKYRRERKNRDVFRALLDEM